MSQKIYTDKDGLALGGYDAVSYQLETGPMPGDPTITSEWRGTTWVFANAANRDTFAANPEQYAPQFGGHCAVGKATGVSVEGSPKRWRIEDGKLFLNKNLAAAKVYPMLASRIHKLADRSAPR